MITEHHYIARKLVRCTDKSAYRLHMCGLCHALGDGYGLVSRLLTTYDAILLNLLTSAQQPHEPEVVMRRCPLNPTMQVRTNQDSASAFAAAASVRLAYAAVEDDLQDQDGMGLKARLAAGLLRRPAARASDQLAPHSITAFDTLTADQSDAERNGDKPARPTADLAAALFRTTADLAGIPANVPTLATVGASYGEYLYYADAYRDLQDDLRTGAFNPLSDFADAAGKLSDAGATWLIQHLTGLLDRLSEALAALTLYRDRNTLERLLTAPMRDLIGQIGGGCTTGSCGCQVSFARSDSNEKAKKRRKTHDRDSAATACCGDGCFYCGDCTDCCDCDCCSCSGCDCDGGCCCPCAD